MCGFCYKVYEMRVLWQKTLACKRKFMLVPMGALKVNYLLLETLNESLKIILNKSWFYVWNKISPTWPWNHCEGQDPHRLRTCLRSLHLHLHNYYYCSKARILTAWRPAWWACAYTSRTTTAARHLHIQGYYFSRDKLSTACWTKGSQIEKKSANIWTLS